MSSPRCREQMTSLSINRFQHQQSANQSGGGRYEIQRPSPVKAVDDDRHLRSTNSAKSQSHSTHKERRIPIRKIPKNNNKSRLIK